MAYLNFVNINHRMNTLNAMGTKSKKEIPEPFVYLNQFFQCLDHICKSYKHTISIKGILQRDNLHGQRHANLT
jgi:hypothetical protein